MDYIKNPMKIEERSFEIIQGIIDDIRPGYEYFRYVHIRYHQRWNKIRIKNKRRDFFGLY